jgi:hypothetical protein
MSLTTPTQETWISWCGNHWIFFVCTQIKSRGYTEPHTAVMLISFRCKSCHYNLLTRVRTYNDMHLKWLKENVPFEARLERAVNCSLDCTSIVFGRSVSRFHTYMWHFEQPIQWFVVCITEREAQEVFQSELTRQVLPLLVSKHLAVADDYRGMSVSYGICVHILFLRRVWSIRWNCSHHSHKKGTYQQLTLMLSFLLQV